MSSAVSYEVLDLALEVKINHMGPKFGLNVIRVNPSVLVLFVIPGFAHLLILIGGAGLFIPLPGIRICGFHSELVWVNVDELSSISMAVTREFVLVIVVVRGGQKVPENQRRHIDLLALVYFSGNAATAVAC